MFLKKHIIFWGFLFSLGLVFTYAAHALEATQVKKGNFALPASQQPGPLFGFGQNVIDSGTLQILGYFDYQKAHDQDEFNVVPSLLYGITDRLAFLGFIQAKAYSNVDGIHTSRVNQVGLQFEYSVQADKRATRIDEITLVIGSNFATSPNIQQDFFSTSFFLGATVSRTTVDWYFFVSPAVILPTQRGNSKSGNTLAVQAGLGKNIPTSSKFIFLGMLELAMISSQRATRLGSLDQDSGNQILYIGPTLWFSSSSFLAQAGLAFPVYQHIKGVQDKSRYVIALSIGITV